MVLLINFLRYQRATKAVEAKAAAANRTLLKFLVGRPAVAGVAPVRVLTWHLMATPMDSGHNNNPRGTMFKALSGASLYGNHIRILNYLWVLCLILRLSIKLHRSFGAKISLH